MITCDACGHASYVSREGDACMCCYARIVRRPDWASADADDLRITYTRNDRGVVVRKVAR